MNHGLTEYSYQTKLSMPYEKAIEKVTAALKEEGFGVMTEVNVKSTLNEKIGVDDFRKYIILGACNPSLAYQALQIQQDAGLLLPCNVIVYEEDADTSFVSILDPITILGVANNPELNSVAEEAQNRLRRVMESLS
ncbi:MAG: DUF302 domain-containing protein [candidate division Zixibacteria bacterium]|nr:DUF302 domain-containing protein [Gammaproteobacteria bacterium]NIR65394.1 DUF302 domain-containing protein [candidate division Zixibacteria bacterium]NIS47088.1 DUF302 domain-containing protein [candidate division Zixibacteria bacterium]NIT51717.1 DUF302 domain-containing protein [candidate division Zixibacteria bacterium]NIU15224.1 DUF302 domain-containing protein [candidate division Zixibacteria bacterium]